MPSSAGGTSSASLNSTSAPPKRACDACHRRKVKCMQAQDPSQPCRNCSHSALRCTYNAVPQKKGPKGCRAKVISELRETQRTRIDDGFLSSPPASPLFSRTPGSLPQPLIERCVQYYFANIYPTQPILHRLSLQTSIANMYQSPEAFVLVEALVAYMCIQPNMNLPRNMIPDSKISNTTELGKYLLADALEMRKSFSYFENANPTSVTTSFFFFGCYFCLERHNSAWFHLREATTLAIILGMHKEENYVGGDRIANMLKRRLFWLLFVTERAYALQTQKPLTLHATIEPPAINENPQEAKELQGFLHLISLFKPFDDTFVGLWNQSLDKCDPDWILSLQQQLDEALPKYLDSTETQAVDLRTSQQWLKIMIWQLSISQKLLSSKAKNSALTLKFPIELSREMVQEANSFKKEAMEVHGIGLIKKMFDVACTLVDVMTCVQPEQWGFEVGPREYLNDFIDIMKRLRGGQDRYLPMLIQKANESLPHLQNLTMPKALPSAAPGFVQETFDFDESRASTSDDSDFMNSPTLMAVPKSESADFVVDPATFAAFSEAEAFAPASIIPPFMAPPTSNPFGG